jgi:hypothetical protein
VVFAMAIGGNTTNISFCGALATPELSVASTVKFQLPAWIAIPVSAPVALFSVNPGGNAPAVTAHVYPPAPPAAVRFNGHDVPSRQPGAATVMTTGRAVARILNQMSPFWGVEEKSGMVKL